MNTHELEQQPDIKRLVGNPEQTQARVVIDMAYDASSCEMVCVPECGLELFTDRETGYPRDVDDDRELWRPADYFERSSEDGGPFWKCPFGKPGDRHVWGGVEFEVMDVRPEWAGIEGWLWAGEFKRV